MTLPELTTALSVLASKAGFFGRFLAVLVYTGFLSWRKLAFEKNRYSLTPAAIAKGQSLNLSPIILLTLDLIFIEPFHYMSEWLKSDSENGLSSSRYDMFYL
ncbi:hypothetical protein ACJRO7_001862 [Eucalyptus globulus]|uniref:Uncharacterized protein n=1 Tax=Eucalyptus globulus TaxID=34317 RepID=A0ABD3LVM8_EUCGL